MAWPGGGIGKLEGRTDFFRQADGGRTDFLEVSHLASNACARGIEKFAVFTCTICRPPPTWMRHVIRLQAKDIVRSILKEEKTKNEAIQNSTINKKNHITLH